MNSVNRSSKDFDRADVSTIGASEGHIPPRPVVQPNVTQVGLPSQSESVEVEGMTLDYLPVAVYCKNVRGCSRNVTKILSPVMAIMMPNGNVVRKCKAGRVSQNSLLFTLMIDPNSSLGDGTTIKKTRFWQRLTQSWIPSNEPHVIKLAFTEGITETESRSLSFAVGAKVSFSKSINTELSAALTKSFSYSVTIKSETTVTNEFPFDKKPVEQVVGVYQLMEKYMVQPGANLANYIETANNDPWQKIAYWTFFTAETPVTYPTSSFLQIAGTNDPTHIVERRMLSQEAIRGLVKTSITLTVE